MGKTSLSTVNGGIFYKTLKNVLLMLTQAETQAPAGAKTSPMLFSPSVYFAFYQNHPTKIARTEVFYPLKGVLSLTAV